MSLVHDFLAAVERHPERMAVIDGQGRGVTYAGLAERSAVLAAAWRAAGVAEGDKVLLALPLGTDLYAALAGLWRLGATVVLPEPALGLAGLRHAARTQAPKAYLSSGFRYGALRWITPETRAIPLHLGLQASSGSGAAPLAPADASRAALVSFTSGSTGTPKSIVRSHGFLAAQAAALDPLLRPSREDEVDLVAFPVFALLNLRQGVTSVLPDWDVRRHDRLAPERACRHLRTHGVTRLLVPPSALERIVQGHLPRGIHRVFTGGGPVYPDLVRRVGDAAPWVETVAVYGSTEAEPIAHVEAAEVSDADACLMNSGGGILAGYPVPEVRVCIMDDEIWVSGAHVVQGYGDPAHDVSTKVRQGEVVWHRTGDAGRIDETGRLWLLGHHGARAGGLYPFQAEVAARSWPGVRRVAFAAGRRGPILAIEGDRENTVVWRREAARVFVGVEVVPVKAIPLDRRHRSKVDGAALARLLE